MSIHPTVAEARKLLGKPFRHRARGPLYYDCAGLCIAAYKSATGRDVIDVRNYGREPHRDGLRAAIEANAGPPIIGEPMPGDIAMIRFASEPHHLAVIGQLEYGPLSLIHSSGEFGRVIEHVYDARWRALTVAVYRPEVPGWHG